MEITLHQQPNKTDRVNQEEGLWSSQEGFRIGVLPGLAFF